MTGSVEMYFFFLLNTEITRDRSYDKEIFSQSLEYFWITLDLAASILL